MTEFTDPRRIDQDSILLYVPEIYMQEHRWRGADKALTYDQIAQLARTRPIYQPAQRLDGNLQHVSYIYCLGFSVLFPHFAARQWRKMRK